MEDLSQSLSILGRSESSTISSLAFAVSFIHSSKKKLSKRSERNHKETAKIRKTLGGTSDKQDDQTQPCSDSTKVSRYRDVVNKEGVVIKEEDQLALDVKGSFLLLDGHNVVIEQIWGAPKVKNVGASLVKLVANATNDVAGDVVDCDECWLE
ncbi:hypothetical protein Bca101_058196 [Brassica carinata]